MLDFNDTQKPVETRRILDDRERDELRAGLIAGLSSVLATLFPAGKRRRGKFLIGDVLGSPGDSLEVVLDGEKAGLWTDRADDSGGDVYALIGNHFGIDVTHDFSRVLDTAADLLGRARSTPGRKGKRKAVPIDELGPATAKWDYLSATGELIACVYRYDPEPGKKEFRPWDVRARMCRAPDPRPLYNLPDVSRADSVILVEGEKCADALIRMGIPATTAMNGAKAPIDKTDWMPLAGKTVAVWPDHDEAGARYAAAVIQKLASIGATVRRVHVPQDKPAKWDAADAVAEGFDVEALLHASQPVADTAAAPALDITRWRAAERFIGQPQQRRWLVEGVFPQAQAALIAAAGGVVIEIGQRHHQLAQVGEADGFRVDFAVGIV